VRNSNLGFALISFTSTRSTISGLETFGDNQFVTPSRRFGPAQSGKSINSATTESCRRLTLLRFGINFIHEPVSAARWPPAELF